LPRKSNKAESLPWKACWNERERATATSRSQQRPNETHQKLRQRRSRSVPMILCVCWSCRTANSGIRQSKTCDRILSSTYCCCTLLVLSMPSEPPIGHNGVKKLLTSSSQDFVGNADPLNHCRRWAGLPHCFTKIQSKPDFATPSLSFCVYLRV
jgi:hypothetical protein